MITAARWSDEGSSRVQLMPVVDPDLVRGLGVGQAAYVYQGGATYVQVKRLVAAPAPCPAPVAGRSSRCRGRRPTTRCRWPPLVPQMLAAQMPAPQIPAAAYRRLRPHRLPLLHRLAMHRRHGRRCS